LDVPVTTSVRRVLLRSRSRAVLAALALTTTAPLTACSGGPEIHPGDAAVVGGSAISLERVDAFAKDLCALQKPALAQQGAVLPMALLRSEAVEVLVVDELLPAFAEEAGIDLPAVRRGVRDEVAKAVEGVPADIVDEAEARLHLEGARVTVLELIGQEGATSQEQATAQGAAIFNAWREEQDVTIDPRFGAVDLDQLAWSGGNGSLSVGPDDQLEPLDQKAAAKLPADQRCGAPA
jgi:hypothetical protein